MAQAYNGWDNFHFTSEQRDDSSVSGPLADPDGDGRPNWLEYAMGSDPWISDTNNLGFGLVTISGKKYATVSYVRPANALDVTYALQVRTNLVNGVWSSIGSTVTTTTSLSSNRESISVRESKVATDPSRFYRLFLTFEEP